jgi:hypothetical protein
LSIHPVAESSVFRLACRLPLLPRSRNRENSPLAMKAAKQENRNSFTVPNSKLSVKESMDICIYIYIYEVAKREEYFLIILRKECRLSPLLRRKTSGKKKTDSQRERKNTHTQSLHILSAKVADIIMSRRKKFFS